MPELAGKTAPWGAAHEQRFASEAGLGSPWGVDAGAAHWLAHAARDGASQNRAPGNRRILLSHWAKTALF